jgi:hypothetical protein
MVLFFARANFGCRFISVSYDTARGTVAAQTGVDARIGARTADACDAIGHDYGLSSIESPVVN